MWINTRILMHQMEKSVSLSSTNQKINLLYQIELEVESRNFLVINTHKGLYHFNRLSYKITSKPAILQQVIDQILSTEEERTLEQDTESLKAKKL